MSFAEDFFGDGIFLMLFSGDDAPPQPQILDFMVAARGYILGIACLGNRHVHSSRIIDRGIF